MRNSILFLLQKQKKIRDRQESCESRSKMSAFLPARQLWGWSGNGYKRSKAKGRSRKMFYKAIQRGKETIVVSNYKFFIKINYYCQNEYLGFKLMLQN